MTGMSDKEKTHAITKAVMNIEIIPSFPKEKASQRGLMKVPLAGLAAGSVGLSSLADALGTLAQTAPITTGAAEQLYKINWHGYAGSLAVLKAHPGEYITTVIGNKGIVGQAGIVPVDAAQVTRTVSAIDPCMLMMAAAIAGVEAELKDIKETAQNILDFLEEDKQASMRGDMNVLAEVLNNYRHNIGNERYRESREKEILAIRRDAEKNIEFYHHRIEKLLADRKLIHMSAEVAGKRESLDTDLRNYQASLYLYSFSTFLEVMLLENFEEDYLRSVDRKLESYSLAYRQTYTDASLFIEELSKSSVQAGLLGGIAAAGRGLGKLIGSAPLIKKGPVDELLADGGTAVESFRDNLTQSDVTTLAERKDSCVEPFRKNIETVRRAYHEPLEAIIDGENVWLKLGTA